MALIITPMFYNTSSAFVIYLAIVLHILLTAKSVSTAVEKVVLGISSYGTPIMCLGNREGRDVSHWVEALSQKKILIYNKLSQSSY